MLSLQICFKCILFFTYLVNQIICYQYIIHIRTTNSVEITKFFFFFAAGVSGSDCERYLKKLGDPVDWFATCSECTQLAHEAESIWLQILALKKTLHPILGNLKSKLRARGPIMAPTSNYFKDLYNRVYESQLIGPTNVDPNIKVVSANDRSHSEDNCNISNNLDSGAEPVYTETCTECGLKLQTVKQLRRHIRNAHRQRLTCDLCNKKFFSKNGQFYKKMS